MGSKTTEYEYYDTKHIEVDNGKWYGHFSVYCENEKIEENMLEILKEAALKFVDLLIDRTTWGFTHKNKLDFINT